MNVDMSFSIPSLSNMQLPTGLPASGFSSTRTSDGSVVSIVFDKFKANSDANDKTQSAEATILNFEVPVSPAGSGLVRVEARGFMATIGAHSWVHAVMWVNGQRMEPISNAGEVGENFYAALCVDATGQSALRVSVTLLAQRDLAVQGSSAQVALDVLDFSALLRPQAR
jgi:hypothetical protein